MTTLFLFDHRHSLEVVPNVAEIDMDSLVESMPAGSALASEAEATHCIVHFKPEQLNKAEGRRDLCAFPDLQIFLCLTTDGFPDRPGFNERQRQHKVCRDGGKCRYVLYARDVNALKSRETREAFYAMGEAEAEAVVKGDWRKVPPALRRLFHRTQIIYLSSLAILLQGYLAAHAEYKGLRDWNDADIRGALIEMGWDKFAGEAGHLPSREALGESKEAVRGKEWFLEPFMSRETGTAAGKPLAHLNLRSKVLEEWGGGDDCTLPEGIENLLQALEDENLKTVDSPEMVASAYLDISRRLKWWPASAAPPVE